jgi:TBC1 domain family member 15
MTIELDSTLAQAEVLFLSFAQLVADIDRRQAEEMSSTSANNLRHRKPATSPSPENINVPNVALPTISENLRDLLKM